MEKLVSEEISNYRALPSIPQLTPTEKERKRLLSLQMLDELHNTKLITYLQTESAIHQYSTWGFFIMVTARIIKPVGFPAVLVFAERNPVKCHTHGGDWNTEVNQNDQLLKIKSFKCKWILVCPHRMLRPWSGQQELPQLLDNIHEFDSNNPLGPGVIRTNGSVRT
uniref:Uncharacterized protein n=1 Tax=Glossina brevipalpis TaxID=37001 RepID=A0A1A9WHU9_9MUSC